MMTSPIQHLLQTGSILRINDRLALRLRRPEHAEALFTLVEANRAYLRQWLPWLDGCKTLDGIRTHLDECVRNAEAGRALELGIWLDGQLVGVTGYHTISVGNRAGRIGYWLDQAHQGQCLMTASVRALVDYGFDSLGLNRQDICAATGNTRSRAVAERLGFPFEGVAREAEWLYDHFVDHAVYAVTRKDWDNRRSLPTADLRPGQDRPPPADSPTIRPLAAADCAALAAAFEAQGWQTTEAKFDRLLAAQLKGDSQTLVSSHSAALTGHVTIHWGHPPVITDLNVLTAWQRRGIATALLEAAEALVFARSDVVRMEVGLDQDYGPAQRLYARRGYIPDGMGAHSHQRPIRFGDKLTVDDDLVLRLEKHAPREHPIIFP